ncbi:MAG: hypothetical protein HYT70_01970 [Candidatus Aenigmarchaeota archaeon]|nr:hypothetical protein [Candidatus Aenigmarchaeota archaeon]
MSEINTEKKYTGILQLLLVTLMIEGIVNVAVMISIILFNYNFLQLFSNIIFQINPTKIYVAIFGTIGIFKIISIYALYKWKKWGFYGIVGCYILTALIDFFITKSLSPQIILRGIIGPVFLFGLFIIDKKWGYLE